MNFATWSAYAVMRENGNTASHVCKMKGSHELSKMYITVYPIYTHTICLRCCVRFSITAGMDEYIVQVKNLSEVAGVEIFYLGGVII